MGGWVKKIGAVLLLALLLSLQFGTVQETKALTENATSITFRRAVVAWYDEKGKLQMNVTWVNKTIDFANLTNTPCPCHNSSSCNASNLTPNLNVSVVTLYNMTEKHEQLLFFGITIYNETFNYTMYALVYKAERSQYNFTLVTRIFTDPETGEYRVFVTAINIAPREDRVVPVGDTIVTADNLTLSEYYWTLNRVLMKLRRGDETNWIWGRNAYELRHLSHLVRLKLPEYNQKKAVGVSAILDSEYLLYAPSLGLFVVKIYCGNPIMPMAYVYVTAYASLIGIVAECGTGIGCIASALGVTAATRGLCEYWKVCLTIGGFYTLSCTYA